MKTTEKICVGIDFAKEKFDACYLDENGVIVHGQFDNARKDFRKLLSWVKKNAGVSGAVDPDEVLFCAEHTGECSLPLSEWLVANGYRMWLDNPVRIKHSAGIVRGKSDKADALMIAEYAMEKYKPGESILFTPDTEAVKKLKSLYCCRTQLVKERVSMGNRISSGSFAHSSASAKAIDKLHRELSTLADELEDEMKNLMSTDPEIARNYRILISFKGIGTLTAAMLIVYTSNFTRFSTPREFACHIGVAPFGKDSGRSVHTGPHVSSFAHKKAKSAMTEAARAAMRFNPAIREYAERLRKKGKHEGLILNNVKNKIIHIVFKMIQNHTEWIADYGQSHVSGNRSLKPLGVEKKGAAEATPCADVSVQSSLSAFGGVQNYTKTKKSGKLTEKSCRKTCAET